MTSVTFWYNIGYAKLHFDSYEEEAMNKFVRAAGMFLLISVLVFSLAACGQQAAQPTPAAEETKEIAVETAPPSPTPTPTPTPSVPPVAVTTVPMPMPSVSPTVSITETPDPTGATAATAASPTVSPSPSVSPSPTPTPYSYDAEFASTILPDSVTIPENAVSGYISANGVNFRGGPSASAKIIGTLNSGTAVSILGAENGWTEIVVNGVAGYVKSDYVVKGEYVSGSSAYISSGSTSGTGVVIVPESTTHSSSSAGATSSAAQETYFMGIVPD